MGGVAELSKGELASSRISNKKKGTAMLHT